MWYLSVLNKTFPNIAAHVDSFLDWVHSFDVDYWAWVAWLIYPILITFLLPLVILLFLYASALFLHVYNYRRSLKEAYEVDIWDGARKTLAVLWDAQARIWHGYEIVGLQKIPKEGPALLIYYHGTIPIDFYYVIARVMLEHDRHIRAVGDNFLFYIPGWRLLMDVMKVTPGTVQSCVHVLHEGHLLGIAPGGVREALFGDEYYQIMWGKRMGFAKAAIQANVPIIPVFTQNCREAFRTPNLGKAWLRKLYEKTRLPIMPIYGLFPVKLRTFIGDPIYPNPDMSADELRNKVEAAVNLLILDHQRIPGNILFALIDRLR